MNKKKLVSTFCVGDCRRASASRARPRGARTCGPACARAWPTCTWTSARTRSGRPRAAAGWPRSGGRSAFPRSVCTGTLTSWTTSHRRTSGTFRKAPVSPSQLGRLRVSSAPTDRYSYKSYGFEHINVVILLILYNIWKNTISRCRRGER